MLTPRLCDNDEDDDDDSENYGHVYNRSSRTATAVAVGELGGGPKLGSSARGKRDDREPLSALQRREHRRSNLRIME